MLIEGFKAFNSNKTNRYGMSFDEGKAYHASGEISFGNDGNGFHICKHLSDVFRFFDSEDVIVARVIGSGEIVEAELHDWTEPYIEMYAVSDLYVDSFLNREEIINEMKKASSSDVIKFFATYNVKEDEALQILRSNKERFNDRSTYIAFLYYVKKINIYSMNYEEQNKVLRKVFLWTK